MSFKSQAKKLGHATVVGGKVLASTTAAGAVLTATAVVGSVAVAGGSVYGVVANTVNAVKDAYKS